MVRRGICTGVIRGRRITLINNAVPAGVDHVRPKRPRPLSCSSVTTTDPASAPASAHSQARSLVLPTWLTKRNGRAPSACLSRVSDSTSDVSDCRSLAIRGPDIFDLGGFTQEFSALTLYAILPAARVPIADPGALHIGCRSRFDHFAALGASKVPHRVYVIMFRQYLCQRISFACDDVDDACRNIRGFQNLIEVRCAQWVALRRDGDDCIAHRHGGCEQRNKT